MRSSQKEYPNALLNPVGLKRFVNMVWDQTHEVFDQFKRQDHDFT